MKAAEPKNLNDNNFDAGVSALFNAFRHLFTMLGIGIVVLIIWYFTFGGAFTVEERERVLLMNFGVLEEKVYSPDWYWNWPYPVTEIVRIPGPESIQTLTTESFWFFMQPGKKISPDSYENMLTPGKDGYLLTGDSNIVHGAWRMYYHIEDPVTYFKNCLVPDDPAGEDHIFKTS